MTVEMVDGLATSAAVTREELQLATRNHGMPLEGHRYEVTPVGMHYLLIHFDVPEVDADAWTLELGGRVRRPLRLSLEDLRSRPAATLSVTMECAGNGRARLSPRPISQPWLSEAVGTAEWTGTPLAPILEEAGLEADVAELVFTGADRGVQGEVEQEYERSLSAEESMREDVLLAYAINGQPLPPQHGHPLRLLVPGWYGMTSVKWLTRITAVSQPFEGFQMDAYRLRERPGDPGIAVTRIQPRALMVPPGIPDFMTRVRVVDAGPHVLGGRAWSGWGEIVSVEVTVDGGEWTVATLGEPTGPHAWVSWVFGWDAEPGEHVLSCRATDSSGRTQPDIPPWNHHGFQNNAVQRVRVRVRS